MAINAYTGLMGSGKSYEVVSSVIVPAIEAGRSVVTNIDGINQQVIYDYLIATKKADSSKFGRVIHVKNEDLGRPKFFPDESFPDAETSVMPGDIVAIDEAWRFWGQGEKISEEHMQFFRMHRHYVHPETKVSCDVVLIVQSIGDLNRSIRAVVELTAVMTKLKTIGLNKSYRVDLFEGGRTVKSAKFATIVKRYDKKIFPLYQSYAGGKGNEKAMDKRQNVLLNPRIWFIAFGMLLLFSVSSYYVWWFFKGRMNPDSSKVPATTVPAASSQSGISHQSSPQSISRPAETFRVVGEVVINNERWIAVSDISGRVRLENPSAFVGRGFFLVGNIEGQRVTTWTGITAPSSTVSGVIK